MGGLKTYDISFNMAQLFSSKTHHSKNVSVLPNAPEIAECDASTSFVFPPGLSNAPEMSERLGLSELEYVIK